MTIDVRASFAGTAYTCPQSVQREPSEPRVVIGELPALGQALHYMNAISIGQGQHVEVADAAAMFRAEPEELEALVKITWQCWEEIRQWFIEPQAEVYLEKVLGRVGLSGHIDLLSLSPAHRQIRFLDWKSSWIEGDHEQQMLAYATLLLETYTDYDEAWGAVIRPRHKNNAEARVYTRAETDAWLAGLTERLTGQDSKEYRPGVHCQRCPRMVRCQARTDLLRQAQQVMAFDGVGDASNGPRAMLERIGMIRAYCDVAYDALKSEIAGRGGQWEDVVLKEHARETIRYTPSSQRILMNEGFVADDWEKIAKLSKTEITKLAMEKAPRGQKGARAEAVLEQLREAGAIQTSFFKTPEILRTKEIKHAT